MLVPSGPPLYNGTYNYSIIVPDIYNWPIKVTSHDNQFDIIIKNKRCFLTFLILVRVNELFVHPIGL